MNENESQTKPKESKRIKQQIEYELSNIIDNNNTFYFAAFHSQDSILIWRKPKN